MRLPHKSQATPKEYNLTGYKALIVTTSYKTLDTIDNKTGKVTKVGKPTGVYASEMTEPYYTFIDAGMEVDVASIKGGKIPIEKLSLFPIVRTREDSRFLKDNILQDKANNSLSISDVNILEYDVIFLSGGWGAAYDFVQSENLARKISEAFASKKVLAAVCHGPLGFISALKPDGSPLMENVKSTGVTNKQLKELMVGQTPKHPESELKNIGAKYQCNSGIIDMFKNHIVIDDNYLIVTGQNQKGGIEVARAALDLLITRQ